MKGVAIVETDEYIEIEPGDGLRYRYWFDTGEYYVCLNDNFTRMQWGYSLSEARDKNRVLKGVNQLRLSGISEKLLTIFEQALQTKQHRRIWIQKRTPADDRLNLKQRLN
ncbi:hypothetical protein [Parabacteroides sp. PF5-9]|uniref:hypothetical protein n=1 Tax=Parabacteroides sp. PF5-9 TaxID=1742404 RepID=UPI002474B16A|nr:hypothetical protein [Parabacteroides sp. PF5-9]MDH6357618.1 hypothetical protein [Parabacteroides sp. PF5-9]